MKITLLPALLAFLALATPRLPAQAPAPAPPAAPAPAAHTSLWRLRGTPVEVNIIAAVYFLDTVDYPLPEVMEQAYEKSTRIAFESDLVALDSVPFQEKMQSRALLPEGEKLTARLDPATLAAFSEMVGRKNFDASQFDRVQPWMASFLLIALNVEMMQIQPRFAVDRYFFTKAGADGKTIIPLESADAQMDVYMGLNQTEQNDFIKQTIEDMDLTSANMVDLRSAWRRGDTARLESVLLKSYRAYPSMDRKLLADRNAVWLKTTLDLINKSRPEDGPLLLVITAPNLLGQGGLLDLIVQSGLPADQL